MDTAESNNYKNFQTIEVAIYTPKISTKRRVLGGHPNQQPENKLLAIAKNNNQVLGNLEDFEICSDITFLSCWMCQKTMKPSVLNRNAMSAMTYRPICIHKPREGS
jgi:hypothetical protein